jgi:hypothetical protein
MSNRPAKANKPGQAGPRRGQPAALPAPIPADERPAARRISQSAVAAIAVGMVACVVWMSGKDILWPEDSFSDVNTLMAAEAFDHNGFWRLHFLPVHYAPSVGEKPNYYTHYPPLPDVVCGLARRLGGRSVAAQRIVCGLVGVAGWTLLAWAISLRLGWVAGAMALFFTATSGFFLSYGVSVHQHGFNALFVGAFLACFLMATQEAKQAPPAPEAPQPAPHPESRRHLWWTLAWTALFLESWTSFEFIAFAQVFAWLYVIVAGQLRRRWKALLLLAAAPVAGVALHFMQNAWAMGWEAARADFLGYGQYGGETLWTRLREMPRVVSANIELRFGWEWYLPLLAAGACALSDALSRRPAGEVRSRGALLAGLAAAPLAWYVGMASHAVPHPHTVGQIMPLAAAAFGGAAGIVATRLFAMRTPTFARMATLGGLLVLIVAGHGQWKTVRERAAAKPLMGWPVPIARALGPEAFGEKNGVLFNLPPEAKIGYFLRNCAQLCQMRQTPSGPPEFARPDSLRGKPFVESFPLLREMVGADWTYRYYLFLHMSGDQEELFHLLKTTCRGEVLMVEDSSGGFSPLEGRYRSGEVAWQIVRFDVAPLCQPASSRPALPQDVLERQLQNQFTPWIVPGFTARLNALMAKPAPAR